MHHPHSVPDAGACLAGLKQALTYPRPPAGPAAGAPVKPELGGEGGAAEECEGAGCEGDGPGAWVQAASAAVVGRRLLQLEGQACPQALASGGGWAAWRSWRRAVAAARSGAELAPLVLHLARRMDPAYLKPGADAGLGAALSHALGLPQGGASAEPHGATQADTAWRGGAPPTCLGVDQAVAALFGAVDWRRMQVAWQPPAAGPAGPGMQQGAQPAEWAQPPNPHRRASWGGAAAAMAAAADHHQPRGQRSRPGSPTPHLLGAGSRGASPGRSGRATAAPQPPHGGRGARMEVDDGPLWSGPGGRPPPGHQPAPHQPKSEEAGGLGHGPFGGSGVGTPLPAGKLGGCGLGGGAKAQLLVSCVAMDHSPNQEELRQIAAGRI